MVITVEKMNLGRVLDSVRLRPFWYMGLQLCEILQAWLLYDSDDSYSVTTACSILVLQVWLGLRTLNEGSNWVRRHKNVIEYCVRAFS